MPLSGWGVAYITVGGIVLFSGVKGATISDTVKAISQGNLNVTDTQPIGWNPGGTATGNAGSASNAVSGSGNYLTIAQYLVANGYSKAAAAGIVGCIAGESGGDPEAQEGGSSGGEGLIQWTPESAYPGLVTGNATKDLDAQLPAIIAYNNAQGAGLVQMLNAIENPVQAADFYSENFERPAVTDSDVRAGVAQSVYQELVAGTGGTTGMSGTTAKAA
jgi:Phage tail lysozyme